MKKILVQSIALVFALGIGSAYAAEDIYNAVTDFTGRSYEVLEMNPALPETSMERSVDGVEAGGVRADEDLYNGITDFTGRSYEILAMNPAIPEKSVEGVEAGGVRTIDRDLYNGITDFTGRSYERLEMNLAVPEGDAL